MNRLLPLVLAVALLGCGQKDDVPTRIEKQEQEGAAPSGPGAGRDGEGAKVVKQKSLAEYIKNKRVYVGVGAETGFGQFYGNGTWQSGSIVDGVATTSGGPDEKGRYEVNELTITLFSEDAGRTIAWGPRGQSPPRMRRTAAPGFKTVGMGKGGRS